MQPEKPKKSSGPILQSFLLADHVYMDALSGKKVIAGTFDRLVATDFPSKFLRSTYAYLRFTDVNGPMSIELRYVDLKDNSVLMQATLEVKPPTPSPLASHEVIMEVPPFLMPHPGPYALDAYCNGDPVGTNRIVVDRAQSEQVES